MAKARILIVEDDKIVVMELRDRLQSLGYAVCAVASYGEEAIEKAGEERPDLVLMDIRLRGAVNGVEAAEEIRARFDIPVIYLTAYADEATLQRAKVTEPYGYIIKPFQERELHGAIEMALYKHRMERKLKESARWLGTVLRSIGDGVIATDEQGLVTFMNHVAEALTGWKQEKAFGKDLTEVFHIVNEQTRAGTENPVARVIREGVVVGLANHTMLIARDGREISIDDSAAPIKDDEGNVTGVVLVFRDITERRWAEEALRESEAKYRSLVEQSLQGIVIAQGPPLRLVFANPAYAAILGLTPEEAMSLSPSEIENTIHPEDCPFLLQRFRALLKGAPPRPRAARVIRKDGEMRWLEMFGSRIEYQGKPALQVAVVDITEHKRAEEALGQRTAQLEALRQVGLEITAVLDLDTLLRSIVSQAMELVGGTSGGLYLYRPQRDVLEWSVAVGPILAPIGTILQRGEGLSGRVWETGEPLIVDDYEQWEGRADVYEGYPFGATIGVPVRWGEEFLGVLNVLADPPHTFSPADADLLALFATQAAIAMENARLYEAEQRRRRDAEALRQTALALTSALDWDQVIDRILSQLQQVVPYDSASVQLLREDRMEIVGGRGFPNLPDLLGICFPIDGDNPNREVVRTGAPFIVKDAPAVYEGFRKDPHLRTMIRSWLGVPMLIGERVVGMIALDRSEPDFYTQEHARLAQTFAAQAAIAIENARLFEEIEERRLYLEGVLRAAPDAIVTMDDRHRIVEWNPGAERLFGYSQEDVFGQNIDDLITGPDVVEEAVRFRQIVMGGKDLPAVETVRYRKDGSPVDVIVAASPILVGDELIGVVAVHTDITERKRAEQQLMHMATHDTLTGLPNRVLFNDRLAMALSHAHRDQQRLAVMLLDLDHFKEVNDTLGHSVGDQLLQLVGDRLTNLLRRSDTVARMGGDEFMLVSPEIAGVGDVASVAQRILEAIREPFVFDGHELHVTTSIGLAVYPDDGEDADTLMRNADIAMYHAKEQGRDNYQRYTLAMEVKALE